MLVTGIVIQTTPGQAGAVVARLSAIPEIQIHGTDGESRIAAVWSGESATDFERFSDELLHAESDVLGVFPTYSAA